MDSRSRALVGREGELESVDRALVRLETGRVGGLTFEGEPGIGKTRLLAELRQRADRAGHIVLQGTASEFEALVPFAVVVDALDAYLGSLPAEVTERWPAELRSELSVVFPALGKGPVTKSPGIADERYRVHRAIRELAERLAEDRCLVIILDDLHWADDASLELIGALLRRPPDAAVLIALAFRPGQATGRVNAALAVPGVERVGIGPISRAQAAELVGADPASERLGQVYEVGGGNPFYVEQLFRTETALEPEPGGTGGAVMPRGVAASVAAEIESLSEDAQGLLRSAAVAGEPFEPDVAAEIAGLDPARGLVALDELLAVDLARTTELPRKFKFRHPLVRQAVYGGIPGGLRLAAHGRAAEALASRGAGVATRAHHAEFAASQGDEGAIELLIEAGQESARKAPALAARWFRAALRLLPASDAPRQIELRSMLAQALRSSGQLDACRDALTEAIELIDDPADPARIELITRCAAVERWLGLDREARLRLSRALPEADARGRAALEIELAIDGVFSRDFERAIASGEAALTGAQEVASQPLIGAAAAALCLAEAGAGRVEVARAHRAEAAGVIDQLTDNDLAEQVDALYHLGWAENYLEHYDSALARFDRMIAIVRAGEGARPLVPMMLVKCYPLEALGRLSEAAELCDAAVEATRLDAAAHFLPWALFERAWAQYYLGELREAIASAEESMRISNRSIGGAGPSAGVGPVWVLACALIESGKPERAAELLAPLASDGDIEGAMPVERALFWETFALAEIGAGRLEVAEEYVVSAEADAKAMDLAIPLGASLRTRAALALAAGDPATAAETAAESAAAFASIGARMEVAFSRSLEGRALARSGARDRAVPVLRDAEAELDACGSSRERDSARRELRRLGARAEVRGPAGGGEGGLAALSRREREVADLVTDRRTNREIAAELFLSEKTIESHLRNVFAKLGADSRVEVARIVERTREGPAVDAG